MDLNRYIASVPDFPVPGVDFKDITPLLADVTAFDWTVEAMAATGRRVEATKVAGFDARGFLWSAPVARQLKLPMVPIRKAGKLPRDTATESYQGEYGAESVQLHRDAIVPGDAVLLVDDVIATGGAMRAGCRLVEELGARVAACAAVIRLTGLGAQKQLGDYEVVSLIDY
ncbi:MAG TPA: adenine phosphoribosyltransferase [Candidatus Stackebrandtia excrementipullorum]|nr:adenine phosphoribosyltransferase [Candidatus Stackebrandtia excrementipullorum]